MLLYFIYILNNKYIIKWKRILPYELSEALNFSDTQDKADIALELAKIYFKEKLKKGILLQFKTDGIYKPVDTFRNIQLTRDYEMLSGKDLSLFVNKNEPKKNRISETTINLYVRLQTEGFFKRIV